MTTPTVEEWPCSHCLDDTEGLLDPATGVWRCAVCGIETVIPHTW